MNQFAKLRQQLHKEYMNDLDALAWSEETLKRLGLEELLVHTDKVSVVSWGTAPDVGWDCTISVPAEFRSIVHDICMDSEVDSWSKSKHVAPTFADSATLYTDWLYSEKASFTTRDLVIRFQQIVKEGDVVDGCVVKRNEPQKHSKGYMSLVCEVPDEVS